MPLNPALLAPLFIAGVPALDPVGIVGWTALASVFVLWTTTNVIVNPLGGTPMVALGPVILGSGVLVPGPTPVLGLALAAASLSVDPAGLAKWQAVALEYGTWLAQCGVDTSLMIAFVGLTPGPVTGVGKLLLKGKPDFAKAVGITDVPGKAAWLAVENALVTQLGLALVTPTMVNPGTGGPVTGVGALS